MITFTTRTPSLPKHFSFTIDKGNVRTVMHNIYLLRKSCSSDMRSVDVMYIIARTLRTKFEFMPSTTIETRTDHKGDVSSIKVTVDYSDNQHPKDRTMLWVIKAVSDHNETYKIGNSAVRFLHWVDNSKHLVKLFTKEEAKNTFLFYQQQKAKGEEFADEWEHFLMALIVHAAGQPQQEEAA